MRSGGTMKKILVIGVDYRWFSESICRAFQELEYETCLVNTNISVKSWNLIGRAMISLHGSAERLRHRNRLVCSRKIIKAFDTFKPDLVYVSQGNQMTPETVKYMKGRAKLVLVMGDTLAHFSYTKNNASLFDHVFTYEQSEIAEFKKLGIDAVWFPPCYDEKHYFFQKREKDIDVSFVGTMLPERREMLKRLVDELPDVRFRFYGQYIKINNPIAYISWLFSKYRKIFRNKNIHYTKVNELYNRSKICININNAQAPTSWSTRLPEILGTKSFQLVSSTVLIKQYFDGCLDVFHSYEELKEKILYYLANEAERNEMAVRGYTLVTERYNQVRDAEFIIKNIESSKVNV